ncbi:hypothetical protein V6N13_001421 [Hibiscus sabdariffa]
MYSNFKNGEGFKGKALKDALWKAVRATTVRDYEKAMAETKGILIDAYNWLKAKDPSTWSKSHFSTRSNMILEARDKPILTMMEIIRTQMMHKISKKAEAAHKCWSSHARHERPEEYVDQCYHTSTQIAFYSNLIYPIKGANQWEPIPAMEPILPPVQRRPPGRPKKQRKKSIDEQNNGPSRGQRTLKIKCTKCGKPDHNIRTCRGRVRSNVRHNTQLVVTPIANAPLTPPRRRNLLMNKTMALLGDKGH